jgi:hypothetical protein
MSIVKQKNSSHGNLGAEMLLVQSSTRLRLDISGMATFR